MTEQFPSSGLLFRLDNWPYRSGEVWDRTSAAGLRSATPAGLSSGVLGNFAPPSDGSLNRGVLLGSVLPAFDASSALSAQQSPPVGTFAPPDGRGGIPFWLQTLTPVAVTGGIPANFRAPIDQDPFERAAARTMRSVRPENGRQEGAATRILETYAPHAARGLADLITLPGREPVPMPKGLQVNDAGEWLVNGRPVVETAEGRAWLEDQQRRVDWGPAMALLLALARGPNSIRNPSTRPVPPSATPETLSQPRPVPPASLTHGRLFDYSRLHETPDVPQFDLERYVPPLGVPERVQALANPANVERVSEAVRRGVAPHGREFYNTEPLREAFIAELGPEKGQAAYDKYLNLVGATSPASKVGDNIRNAAYHYMRSQQGFPPPAVRWDREKWRLVEPLPPPWGHIAQGLHAKKVGEVLAKGELPALTNPKSASYVQNLRGNQRPVTIDRHNARLWDVRDLHGNPVDIPPGAGYGFLERLQQEEAAKQGLTPAQYQASAWIGGARQTGVRSPLAPWLDSFGARVALSAKKMQLKPEEMLRRFIHGELPLWSLGGAASAGLVSQPITEADE